MRYGTSDEADTDIADNSSKMRTRKSHRRTDKNYRSSIPNLRSTRANKRNIITVITPEIPRAIENQYLSSK
jgi:hypothetical protein